MPMSYNLRSLQRKRRTNVSIRNCYVHNTPDYDLPEAYTPKVCLERLRLLECHDNQNSRYYLQKGKIKLKESNSIFSNKKKLLKVLCLFVLVTTSFVYWREYLQISGISFVKNYSEIHPSLQSYYYDTVKVFKSFVKEIKQKEQKTAKHDADPIFEVLKVNSTLTDYTTEIRQLVRDYFVEMKKKNKNQNTVKSSETFIEEQCKREVNDNFYSKKKKFYNATFHDMLNLTDYALESLGAKILTVFDTELYATITVKYLNINLGPQLSNFLMKYMKSFIANGPNSILMPWRKPGDCWAFKGSHGKVQIQLPFEIIVAAVTVEHIPKEVTSEENIHSAPKMFSVSGVEDSGNSNKTFLGRYEYKISGSAAQTFFIRPKVEIPFRIIEIVFESNHGNDKYTCVYKVRIQAHK